MIKIFTFLALVGMASASPNNLSLGTSLANSIRAAIQNTGGDESKLQQLQHTIAAQVKGRVGTHWLSSSRAKPGFETGSNGIVSAACPNGFDFSQTCPNGWSSEGSLCSPPGNYSGPCSVLNFAGFSDSQKFSVAQRCSAAFPCKGSSFLQGPAIFDFPAEIFGDVNKSPISQVNILAEYSPEGVDNAELTAERRLDAIDSRMNVSNAKSVAQSRASFTRGLESNLARIQGHSFLQSKLDPIVGPLAQQINWQMGVPIQIGVFEEVPKVGFIDASEALDKAESQEAR